MLKWLLGRPTPPKKLKFKKGEWAIIKIGNVKGMITDVFPYGRHDYEFEWWNTKTMTPNRYEVEEFEIKKVKKNSRKR